VWRLERERQAARGGGLFTQQRRMDGEHSPHWPVQIISTIGDFKRAIQHERCVIFPDSSNLMPRIRGKFADLAHAWDRLHPDTVRFYRIDFTNPQGPHWDTVEEWMDKELIPPGGLKNYGCHGKFVWIRNKKSQGFDWHWDIYQMQTADLLHKTKGLLGPHPAGNNAAPN